MGHTSEGRQDKKEMVMGRGGHGRGGEKWKCRWRKRGSEGDGWGMMGHVVCEGNK